MMNRQPKTKISFREISEVKEYESDTAIEKDRKLKRGSTPVFTKPETKNSLTKLVRKVTQKFNKTGNNGSGQLQARRKLSVLPVLAEPADRREQSSPVPLVSGAAQDRTSPSPIPFESIGPEIPEDNIKTLLTLGFMSSLAVNIAEDTEDTDNLTENEIDELIKLEKRKEEIEKMKVRPKPVDSTTGGRWNIFSKIPVFTSRPKTEPNRQYYNNYNQYTDPYIPNRTKVPMTNRLTKWSLDGRLVMPRNTEFKKPVEDKIKREIRNVKIENLNKFGKDNNFNHNDQLGPWLLNKPRKSQEVFVDPPPTPAVSKKYIFSKTGESMVNPKKWFESDIDKTKVTRLPNLTSNTNLPRWRI